MAFSLLIYRKKLALMSAVPYVFILPDVFGTVKYFKYGMVRL